MDLRLEEIREEAPDVVTFVFVPSKQLGWRAGQSLRLEITGPYGPLEHRFSISTPPSSGRIGITTRYTDSDYKTSLFTMTPGSIAHSYGLEGDFTWRESATPHLFVAAGIGVTPFIAMLGERAAQSKPLTATLIYGGHDDNLPFRKQLRDWQNTCPELDVQYVVGEHIMPHHLLATAPDARTRDVYISGPSKMVGTLHADLSAAGFDAARLLRDDFTGRLPSDG